MGEFSKEKMKTFFDADEKSYGVFKLILRLKKECCDW